MGLQLNSLDSEGTDPDGSRSVSLLFQEVFQVKCRSCNSTRLVRLDKKETSDHDVYRCRACGHLFSPGDSPGPVSPPPSRTVAVRPGYRTRER